MANQPHLSRGFAAKTPGVSAPAGERRASDRARARSAVAGDLRQLEEVFGEHDWPDLRAFRRARKRARERALHALEYGGSAGEVRRAALLIAATEMLVGLRAPLARSPERAVELVERLQRVTGLSRLALGRQVLRSPELLSDAAPDAIEAQLTMLLAFAPLRSASLWRLEGGENAACMCHVGEGQPSRRAKAMAQRMLSGPAGEAAEQGTRTLTLALPVGRRQQPLAVLAATAKTWMRERSLPLLEEARPMLKAVLERERQLVRNAASERALVESSERKLTRLGFDLHDGPIQDVALLADDVRLFGDQLELLIGPLPERKLARGRIEDLESQLGVLDGQLRRISGEVQAASVLLKRSFELAVADRVEAFRMRTGVKPRLTLRGDMGLISASQQIALLNIIGEALNNIREHADASEVQIALSADEAEVTARIADNGKGFEPEATLARAARSGRVGLLAMRERVRLLGGQCRVESRAGGPTVVSIALERWRPLETAKQNGAGA